MSLEWEGLRCDFAESVSVQDSSVCGNWKTVFSGHSIPQKAS